MLGRLLRVPLTLPLIFLSVFWMIVDLHKPLKDDILIDSEAATVAVVVDVAILH